MKNVSRYLLRRLITGLLIIVPVYLSLLLLLKAMQSLSGLVKPLAVFVPDSLPGETLITLLALLVLCVLVGMLVGTHPGQSMRQRIEKSLVARLPGYALFRSLAEQVAGQGMENVWKPALAEIEEALVPAFIIEELADGRYTVFVPSVPTPLAGAVYILDRARVHPVQVPLTQAMKVISHWGQGSGDLVAAMQPGPRPGEA